MGIYKNSKREKNVSEKKITILAVKQKRHGQEREK